jgi:hypothetical protein
LLPIGTGYGYGGMQVYGRDHEIRSILDFITQNRNSYASLAVCRRAVDPGLSLVTEEVINNLKEHLQQAPDREIEAYFSIVM